MQTGTVQEIGLSKTNKPKVKIDNQWYSIKTTLGFVPGQKIEFEAHEFQFNGKQFWGIDRFGLLPTVAPERQMASEWKPPQTTVVSSQPSLERFVSPPQLPSTPAPISAPAGYTEPERMFVSNIVAAAVTGGHAKDPVDLMAWATGALVALRKMNEQANDAQVPY